MSKIKRALPEGFSVIDKAGVNQIIIWEPRWRDRRVLVADRRICPENEIIIIAKDKDGRPYFPESFYITDTQAKKYPLEMMNTKSGYKIAVRAIPLDDLEKEILDV